MNLEEQKTDITKKDPNAASRKQDHIELAFQSQIDSGKLDNRFYYEPLLAGHPTPTTETFSFLNKKMLHPIWISSMTGGTALAGKINHNLARVCKDFGLGMGLGSCRGLLESDEYLKDFDIREVMGKELPLFANLGIAQLEQERHKANFERVFTMLSKLQADGLIIHVNPFQEWLQPEGDHFTKAPLETIQAFIEQSPFPTIVKEVGQGMGYHSLKALFQLPIAAIDFAANGGTNFAKLELLRSDKRKRVIYEPLSNIGHSAEDMVDLSNGILNELGDKALVKEVIISGGVKNFLDGYYLINKLNLSCVYGQASGFLKHARGSYQELKEYAQSQVEGLALAKAFLRVKSTEL